jgi:hypothetical protein
MDNAVLQGGALTMTAVWAKIWRWTWLIPAVFIAGLIIHFGVNVPFGDEWTNVAIYQQIDHHHVPAYDLWHQHNEHRIFFPATLSTAAVYASHDNVKAQMLLSLLLAIGALLLMYSVLKEYSLLLALWWLSPIQAENWLWSFEICWFLCVLAFIWSLKRLTEKHLRTAIAAAVVASFSAAIGLAVWPVGWIVLYLSKQPKKWWTVSAAVTFILYFYHYTGSSSTSGKLQLIPAGKYFLALLGGTVTEQPEAAVLVGGVLLSLLLPVGYLAYKNKFRKGHFWMGLILFALLAMTFTDRGRNASGVVQALSSRYTTFTLLYVVGLIGLAYTLAKQAAVRWLVVGLSIPLLVSSYLSGIDNMRSLHTDRMIIKTCTQAVRPDETCLKLVDFFDPLSLTQQRLDYLKSKNWGGY